MSPFTLTAWFLVAAVAAAVIPYVIGKRALNRKARVLKDAAITLGYDPEILESMRESGLMVGDSPESAARRAAREKFRPEAEAVDHYKALAAEVNEQAVRARAIEDVRKSSMAWPQYSETYVPPVFGKRKPSIFLTARQLERVNISRWAAGYTRLNIAGFANAVACAWGGHKPMLVPQPKDTAEWLVCLLLYECLLEAHTSGWADVGTGLTITPDAPYNGQETEFLGAGVSGDWQNPDASTATAAAAIATGTAILTDADIVSGSGGDPLRDGPPGSTPVPDPLSDPNSFKSSSDYDPGLAAYGAPGQRLDG